MKTWLITGASSGLGAATARCVLEAGHNVVITARDAERVGSLAREFPNQTLPVALDLANDLQIKAVVRAALDGFGHIDVLMNSAGISYHAAIEEGIDTDIRDLFETNLFGLAAMIRAVLPGMRKRGSGTIINISSASGIVAYPGLGHYSASKFAVEGLSEALWQEVEPLGLRVILVEPGVFRTGIIGRTPNAPRIPAYAATAHAMIDFIEANDEVNHRGDPARAGAVLLDAVQSGNAPHRLILDDDCYDAVRTKLSEQLADHAAWERVSRSTNFPYPILASLP